MVMAGHEDLDDESQDESSEEEDPIVIKMIASQLTRSKLSVKETLDINSDIQLD